MKVRRALLSVHDKTGVVDFARGLAGLGVEIVSTGGTARLLRESGVPVRDVAEVTGFPEMLDGRVKTLHPRIHGGILARRDVPGHLEALASHGIPPIDLVVVALYPFEATVARPDVALAEAIEQIDVGGPTMIRAAAKNHASVAVVTDPSQYAAVLEELRASGVLGGATRFRLAREAFGRTAQYDAAIAAYLAGLGGADATAASPFPAALTLEAQRESLLRYGENPHQAAAFYRIAGAVPAGLAGMKQLHGPELGYNNVLDFSAALGLLLEFEDPAAVVIKHTNPCGTALGRTVGEAMARAKACDPCLDLRRHRRRQPYPRPGGCPRAGWHLRRDPVRARLRPRRTGGATPHQEEVPRVRGADRAGRPARPPGRVPQRPRRAARAVDRPRRPRPGRARDGDAAGADRGRDSGLCASPGASPSTPSPTPSCWRPPSRWWAWARAR